MYQPQPINTDHVQLPESLHDLIEEIAEQVHDTWAKGRMDQGWTYGESRDDQKKTTPCLVPYKELPPEEQEYDRATAMQTLRLIVYKGYSIVKNSEE